MAIVWDQINAGEGERPVVRLCVPGFNPTDHRSVVKAYTPVTTATGRWALDLDPNDALTPDGTWYTLQDPDSAALQPFLVPSTDPPEGGWWVRDLLTVDPAQPGTTPMSVASVLAAAAAATAEQISEFSSALGGIYGPGGSAGNINKATAQGVALVQALIFGS